MGLPLCRGSEPRLLGAVAIHARFANLAAVFDGNAVALAALGRGIEARFTATVVLVEEPKAVADQARLFIVRVPVAVEYVRGAL
eukprot:scaffold2507_cov81-Phaeocystis_antarctica.AAC.2